MSKSEEIGVFYTLCCISRGRANEIQPETLFEPKSVEQRDELLALEAIRPATESEVALHEKINAAKVKSEDAPKKGGKKAAVEPEADVAADADVATSDTAEPAADAAEPAGDLVG